jgi:hypothetical protein
MVGYALNLAVRAGTIPTPLPTLARGRNHPDVSADPRDWAPPRVSFLR